MLRILIYTLIVNTGNSTKSNKHTFGIPHTDELKCVYYVTLINKLR